MNKKQNNITELVFILDRSGSMGGLESDTIGGFNAMIEKQKKEDGTAYVSTILFDDEAKVLHDRIDLAKVPAMTDRDYTVRGCTALFDAVGGAIRHIGNIHKYARPEDVPAHTLFVITTDGMENASRKFTREDVRHMIARQKERYGWEFIFIGANIDAAETAESMGIAAERAANYRADSAGTQVLFEALSAPISAVRRSAKIDRAWAETLEEDKNSRG
ncbi:MAG: hypothetical protein IJ055_06535 [Oscillospiraceae bacterium]|nr:hypothetical protein [Oscillospiraceae bacterium]